MKTNRYLTALGLVFFFLLCLVPSGQAQTPACVPVSQPASAIWQVGLTCSFNSSSTAYGAFTAKGIAYWQIFAVPSGTVTGAALSIDSSSTGIAASWSTGGIVSAATIGALTSPVLYANSSATTPTNFAQLTPTITGSGTLTVTLFGYINNPSASSSSSGNVNVTNASIPVTLATAPTTPTQPSGFGAGVSFQQAVTASAVVLASNAVHGFCVKALTTNALTIYVGPSGMTTSTGYPLAAGDSVCYQLSNTNLMYVIASSTGSSVAVTGD